MQYDRVVSLQCLDSQSEPSSLFGPDQQPSLVSSISFRQL